jgi:dsDNA-specific endonuclease/ATPase MutS2
LGEYLKAHPLVTELHPASFEEGGTGATIVELDAKPAPGESPATG